jgi:hypothetical protein
MTENSNLTTVALAVHKKIIDQFHAQPLSDEQTISDSIRPDYDILTLETDNYKNIASIVQQYMPFIKVIMPVELDIQIREHMKAYDIQDLSHFVEAV